MDRLVLIKKASTSGVQRVRIMREVAPHWKEMGCLMGINPHQLQSIAMNNRGAEGCVWDIFLVCIGSNCPGISGTVPDLLTLSLVPEGLPICPGRSLISS